MQNFTLSVGVIIAIIVLVLSIVFMAIGRLDIVPGGLIAGVALARIIP